jgi:N-methylhydantoinase A/oxoprolinase/acetone carboxylase beta subunit
VSDWKNDANRLAPARTAIKPSGKYKKRRTHMAVLLGVDTGGTYTDAVLVQDDDRVIASAKSLTTRADLAVGIGSAVAAVIKSANIDPATIAMASLSTTLATNALVEGQGGRVALVYIRFSQKDLASHGLTEALAGDPSLVLSGGHNHAGGETTPLDHTALSNWLKEISGISAFAVASQFGTRNPAHELAAAKIIGAETGAPVSCSHHLSAKLNGPKRALTAVLNARLLGMIDQLISRAQNSLIALGITAPLMVVRGDGALIGSDMARAGPIETILSGPAASIVGAHWLTGADHALVSDIGGTTTDVAVLRDGRPMIDPAGAQVGPYRTMVEAVAMRTSGLGGDSQVHFITEGLVGGVRLGPRRVVPVSLLASEAGDIVHATLDQQLANPVPNEYDGCFVRRLQNMPSGGLADRDAALLDRIGDHVKPLNTVLKIRLETQSLRRLLARGLVQLASVTASDASHALGWATAWDRPAAEKTLPLFGRQRTGAGEMLAKDPQTMARIIVDQLTQQTVLALLETAFGVPPPRS